jgi:putative iron-dependent peroxidase
MRGQNKILNIEIAQKGIFENTSRHARLIEYVIKSSVTEDSVKTVLKELIQYVDSIADLNLNISFGSDCWDRLNPSWRPAELVPFNTLGSGELNMPGTQADIFIWLSSTDAEVIPFSVIDIYEKMKTIADIQLDLEGIKNKQERDLIGFVDGTANKKGDERLPVVLIPEGQLGAGGSYVLSQRWKHDLTAFNHLALHEQEKVVGRTKEEDIELEGDDMPEDSHVSRTDADVDGVGMKIYRRSYPYMASQLDAESEDAKPDNGLYFLALACEMQRFTVQLDRMLGLTDDGISDKLMQFSTPKTGSYWFMPSKNDLANLIDLS